LSAWILPCRWICSKDDLFFAAPPRKEEFGIGSFDIGLPLGKSVFSIAGFPRFAAGSEVVSTERAIADGGMSETAFCRLGFVAFFAVNDARAICG
jgi:hypothetical protein